MLRNSFFLENIIAMKKISSLLVFCLYLSLSLSAQYKTVKKSGSTPKWINGLELNYIIVSGSGETIELAKYEAINRLKENIIKSIADNVRSESKISKSEINNEDIYENFTNTISSISGKIDFLSGLSVNKIEDFYWEKIKDKETKKYSFIYHIKYPFSSDELQALIDEYKFKDNELTETLNKLIEEIDSVSTIEEITTNVYTLRSLKKSFIDKREDLTELTIQKYINLVKKADIEEITNETGIFRFAILINGNRINAAQNPQISSNCANITSNTKDVNIWTIKYDAKDCFEDETNYINISFNFPFATLKKKIFFNVGESKFDISINSPVLIKQEMNEGEKIFKAYIQLKSEYPSAFEVESAIIEFENINPIRINNIAKRFEKNKNYTLIINLSLNEQQLNEIKKTTSLNGYITYKSLLTEETKTYRIYRNKFYIE